MVCCTVRCRGILCVAGEFLQEGRGYIYTRISVKHKAMDLEQGDSGTRPLRTGSVLASPKDGKTAAHKAKPDKNIILLAKNSGLNLPDRLHFRRTRIPIYNFLSYHPRLFIKGEKKTKKKKRNNNIQLPHLSPTLACTEKQIQEESRLLARELSARILKSMRIVSCLPVLDS